ncbi:hypothetical protein ACFPTO_13535 [Paraburkholderia denitrificans]|uniref:Uncharacterized protein n=1 Tax=Paraburkholderia denitrificans TaxID=694025 RepID=A0ABW0J9P3_9BURK
MIVRLADLSDTRCHDRQLFLATLITGQRRVLRIVGHPGIDVQCPLLMAAAAATARFANHACTSNCEAVNASAYALMR